MSVSSQPQLLLVSGSQSAPTNHCNIHTHLHGGSVGLRVLPKDTADWDEAGLEPTASQSLEELLYLLSFSRNTDLLLFGASSLQVRRVRGRENKNKQFSTQLHTTNLNKGLGPDAGAHFEDGRGALLQQTHVALQHPALVIIAGAGLRRRRRSK